MVGTRTLRRIGHAATAEIRASSVMVPPGVRHYFASRVNLFFLFFAGVLYAVAWPTLHVTHELPAYTWPVVAAFAAFPLAFAYSAPLVGWGASAGSALIIGLVVPTVADWHWAIQVTHLIAFLILTFMSYMRCPFRLLAAWWLCSVAVMMVIAPPDARVGWSFGLSAMAVVALLLRGLLNSRQELAERTEQTRAAESAAAVLQERARISRDLHDVVAHRMSMVVVMAQTARYRLPGVDDVVAEEFDAIADAARSSLDEVRQLLGVLRVEGRGTEAGAIPAPNPGLDEVHSLVEQTRRAGAEVTFSDELDHSLFAESAALVIYRIVQESLANATRHAPGSTIDVVLSGAEDGTAAQVLVANTEASGPPLQLGGMGVGITGMIDRARAVGGSLTATPTLGGGFGVRAWIPPASVGASGLPTGSVGVVPITLVVVDDQAMVRQGFSALLGAQPDISVLGDAADGVEAVEICGRLQPDVVLMDVRMPRKDGLWAAARILGDSATPGGNPNADVGASQRPKILMLTTFDIDDYVYEALRIGASGFMLKDAPPMNWCGRCV